MAAAAAQVLLAATLWMMPHMEAAAAVLSSSTAADTHLFMLTGASGVSCRRPKRAISPREMNTLLDYHNRVRSQVFPTAADMEYMVRQCVVY